jgi:hypothetical protein
VEFTAAVGKTSDECLGLYRVGGLAGGWKKAKARGEDDCVVLYRVR